MRDRTVYYLAGLTLLSVFLLWVGWEFVVEDVIWPLFWPDYEEESLQHRWEYVISATVFAGIALIIPTLVSLRSITERKRAEAALRESEERFRNLVAGALQGILIHRHHKPLFVNRAWANLHGYAPEEVMAMESVVLHIAPSDQARLVGYKDARLRGEYAPDRYEYQAVKKDGSTIHLVNHVRIVQWGGQPAIQTTVIDITERRRVEEALRESEERFRAVVDHSPGAIVIKDMEGRNLIANKLFCTWYGTTSEKIIGKSVYDFLAKETADRITAQEQMVMETGTVIEEERQVTYPDGVTRSVFTQKFPIFGPDGDCRAVGNVITDLTERKKAEALLKIAVDSMPEGFAYFDPDDRLAMVNSKIVDTYPMIPDLLVLGVSYETIVRTGVERGQFCPDDGQDKEEWIEKRLAYHRDPKGSVEFNLPDGRCIRVEEVRTPEGGVVGVRTDITDMKKIERQLREARDDLEKRVEERTKELMQSEAWLKAIIKCSPGAMVIRDLEGRNLIVNEIFGDWYAVVRDEIIGKTMVDYLPPEMFKEVAAQEQEVVETKQIVQAERRMTFPNGVTRDVNSQKFPIFGPDGDCMAIGTVITDITERKRAETALRESEETLRAWMDNSQTPITLKDMEGRYLLANKRFGERFNVSGEEIVGKTAYDIFPPEFADEVSAHDREVLETGTATERETQTPLPDGTTRTTIMHKFPIIRPDGGYAGVGTIQIDITERKEAEEALRESEERFRSVIDNSPSFITLKDTDGRYQLVNRKHVEMFGHEQQDVVGKSTFDFFPEKQAIDATAQERKVIETKSAITRERKVSIKHGTRDFLITKFPILDGAGDVIRIGTIGTDITERKEAEAQLIQASKLATLGEMASGIAHELNQPLSVVGMAAENSLISMEEGTFDAEFVRKKLQTIVGQRERMAEIVNHMRLFSRRDTTAMEWFNPVESVRGAVGLIAKQLEASGIELEEDIPAACRNVSGHPLQLEQVVLNLLKNAGDAVLGALESERSGKGRPAPKVRVSLVDDKRRKTVVISVADNGGGIPDQALGRIFDPFFTTKKKGQGTGLGLSISYSIIDAMGGRLEAQNADGGAEFRISVPAAVYGSGAVDRRSRKKKRKAGTRKRRSGLPRVLVVDDEELIAEGLAEYLQVKGYDVATAGSGLEALELHRSRPADIVITDLLMPEMDGNELIRRLRRTHPDLPIVVITGHTSSGDDKESVIEGASVVLKKPIALSELTESLNGLRRR